MKRLLLTAIALGLLSSPAFAGEKTPEQLREESSHILGVEGVNTYRVTRVVPSGKSQQVGFPTSLNPDCTSTGDVDVRVTKEPEHGKVDTSTASLFPNYPKESNRYKCNEHKVKGMQINYKSAEKYTGKDEFDLLILYPGGFASEIHYDMSVH